MGMPARSAISTLVIKVLRNENSPTFSATSSSKRILEIKELGEVIETVTASDSDEEVCLGFDCSHN